MTGPGIRIKRPATIAAVALTSLVMFAVDVSVDNNIAFGAFYVPLVLTALSVSGLRLEWWLAAMASGMVAVGFFLPDISRQPAESLLNRSISIAAILFAAAFVTRERRVQEILEGEVRRAEAAERAKMTIFSNLSHELRTPLNAIVGFADLMCDTARPDQLPAIRHIQKGGRRLLAAFENLVDLARISDMRLAPQPMDVASVVRAAADGQRAAASEKQIAVSVDGASLTDTSIIADHWAVRRVMDALIGNAVKFTPSGGRVKVTLTEGAEGKDGVTVTVSDTGVGMTPDVVARLGEPFYQADTSMTRRFEGLGTGLALACPLSAKLRARLRFESTVGQGTTARLALPRKPPERTERLKPRDRTAAAARSR